VRHNDDVAAAGNRRAMTCSTREALERHTPDINTTDSSDSADTPPSDDLSKRGAISVRERSGGDRLSKFPRLLGCVRRDHHENMGIARALDIDSNEPAAVAAYRAKQFAVLEALAAHERFGATRFAPGVRPRGEQVPRHADQGGIDAAVVPPADLKDPPASPDSGRREGRCGVHRGHRGSLCDWR